MPPPVRDSDILKLAGTVLDSPSRAGVSYRLEEVIGGGAHGIVFSALRALEGESLPVVVKILRPRAVKELAGLAGTAVKKEVAALMRLSERVPATPYVVQFFDTGTLRIADGLLELPWIAVEYVRGGADGVTLSACVEGSIARTAHAFDLARARTAIKCTAAGLASIHEVGVIHRDLTPNNILVSGCAETEVFKISDFGLARVSDTTTFGDVLLGTPGYSAPEQCFPDKVPVGPYTDVFGLACSAYFLLTGEHYFDVLTVPETFVAVQSPERRRIADSRTIVPELTAQPDVCAKLDRVLARATHANPLERPARAGELAGELVRLLVTPPERSV